jgi:predicted secreted Zn-dependent protease
VAPDGLARRWDRSIEALELHESIHRRHALEAIASLASRLEGIGTQPDCIRLRREVYRQRLAVTTRWTWRDRRFDRTTRNGLAEGTRL